MLPGVRADTVAARAGSARARRSVEAAPWVAAWCRGGADLPSCDDEAAGGLRRAAAGFQFGRIAGSFAWGDAGAFGRLVCRAVGDDEAFGALLAPVYAHGIRAVAREERRAALDALPGVAAGVTRRAFELFRGRPDADTLARAARPCLDATRAHTGPPRLRLCAGLAAVAAADWPDELMALGHGAVDIAERVACPDALAADWVACIEGTR